MATLDALQNTLFFAHGYASNVLQERRLSRTVAYGSIATAQSLCHPHPRLTPRIAVELARGSSIGGPT